MKKLHAVILALVAVSAFGAVLVSSASAETTLVALWLANGVAVATELPTESSGNILLEDTKVPIFTRASALCSGILIGTVNSEGKDTITEVLNLKLEPISLIELTGLSLSSAKGDCVNEENCTAPIEVWPLKLPWATQLFLMADGTILDLIVGSGYELLCMTAGVNVIDSCTAADTELLVENDPETGDASSPGGALATPNATCTLSKEATGVNQIDELTEIKLTGSSSTELLTVSSE